MADTKISGLTAVTDVQDTDEFVLARAGTTRKIDGADLLGAIDHIADIFGTPDTAFEFTTSSFTGLQALGSPDIEDAHTSIPSHYYLEDNDNTWVGRLATVPATPWTAIAKMSDSDVRLDFNACGMLLGAASPGGLGCFYHAGANRQFTVSLFTDPSTFSTTVATGPVYTSTPLYFAIRANSGTDYDYLWSYNGYIWTEFLSGANHGAFDDRVGVGILSSGSAKCAAAFDFLRIWNSAKTFPGAP